jgi:putative nucleotidyltransferase with HDIG domain
LVVKTWTDFAAASIQQLLDWAEPQPWAQAMVACSQDALWHAEGDVWTHTCRVARELERLEEWPSFSPQDQLKLAFTALFHDSGKPATTILDPETGRTRSPKHSLAGVEIARRVLREVGCDLAFRETVANLVRYHGRPPYLLEQADPASEVIGLSWKLDHRMLYAFALADTRGRDTRETARPEDNLHLWKLVAEENDCWVQPYPFANDQARFLFYRGQLSSLHYSPREDYRCTVTVMSGLPGSGKDTWLARNHPHLPIVSLDDIRADLDVEPTGDQGAVIQAAREQCREHLRNRRDFAFNATNTLKQTRQRWIDLFADYQARVELVYIEPPLSTIWQQNSQRKQPVPRRVIERLIHKLEPPTLTEAHGLELVG